MTTDAALSDRVGWTSGRLKDMVGQMRNGVWGDEPREDGSDVLCVRAADFDRNKLRVKTDGLPKRHVEQSVLKTQRLLAGDIILEKSGGGERQPVGAAVLFDFDAAAVCSNFCARIRPADWIDSRYLVYSLAAAYYLGLSERSIKQTTGIQNLDGNEFLVAPWSYPSLEEQRRIADFLDAETARIDQLDALRSTQIGLLSELASARVSEAFAFGPDVPTMRLGYLAIIQSGITVDASRATETSEVSRPYLRVANVQAGYLDLNDITEITVPRRLAIASTLRPGDVLMTEGGDLDKLGRGTVWEGQINNCLHQNHVFAVRVDTRRLDPQFLALLTQTMSARIHFESTGTKTTNLASTSSSKIRDLRVPCPSLKDQAATVSRTTAALADIVALRASLVRQRDLLAERRQALITAAVTGQFDVTTARGADVS